MVKILPNTIFCSVSRRYGLRELLVISEVLPFHGKTVLMGDFPILSDFALKMILLKKGYDVRTYFDKFNRMEFYMQNINEFCKALAFFKIEPNKALEVLELFESLDLSERKELFRASKAPDLSLIHEAYNSLGIRVNSEVKHKDKYLVLISEQIYLIKEIRDGVILKIRDLASKLKRFNINWVSIPKMNTVEKES